MNAQKLRELRHKRALTLKELSDCSGVNKTTIHLAETGKAGAHPSSIRKLAAALGVDTEVLVSDEP